MTNKDHLTEKQALAQAKKDGIEFIDEFKVEGSDKVYETKEATEKAAKGKNVIQSRRQQ